MLSAATWVDSLSSGSGEAVIRDTAALGARVKELRLSRGWDQAELAERARVSRGYVSRLENGANPNPKVYDLEQVAQGLEISLHHLLASDEPMDLPAFRAELEALLGRESTIGESILQRAARRPERDRRVLLEVVSQLVDTFPALERTQSDPSG